MKKEFRLAEAIGEADDDMIAQAAPKKNRNRRGFIIKVSAVAACLALIICALPFIKNTQQPKPEPDAKITLTGIKYMLGIKGETALASAWYYDIQDSPYSSYMCGRTIEEDIVGNKIGEVTVKQYLHDYIKNKNEKVAYKKAEIYEIKGVSSEVAVCLRYLEKSDVSKENCYYRYLNPSIDAAFVTEYFEKSAAKDYGSITGFFTYDLKDGNSTHYEMNAERASVLFDMLVSFEGRRSLSDYDFISRALSGARRYAMITMESEAAAWSRTAVFDNGYVLIYSATGHRTDGSEGTIMFFQAENTSEIIDYIRKSFTVSQNDGTVSWVGTTGAEE